MGLATLYRHFPTREALFEALLRTTLDQLTQMSADLETSASPSEALLSWLREAVAFVQAYNGVVSMMATALADDSSALHASCSNLRSAGERLLKRAQSEGEARDDLDGIDLLALVGALGWLGDQPAFASRTDHLLGVIAGAILTKAEQKGSTVPVPEHGC